MQTHLLRSFGTAAGLGFWWLTSCSLTDLDGLTSGDTSSGGKVAGTGGGQGNAAGNRSVAGAAGRVNNVGGSVAAGGLLNSTTLPVTGGGSAGFGGTSDSGGASGAAPVATGGDASCPLYTGTGGNLVTPPTNGFELNTTGWSTTSMRTGSISQVVGGACLGNAYLACAGLQRSAEWDGPAADVLPYVVTGHTYIATIATRFDPTEPPPTDKTLRLVASKTCLDTSIEPVYGHLSERMSTGGWLRLTGTFKVELAGCTQLARLLVYVETNTGAKTSSIQLDDFQLFDTTSADQLGAAGAAGAAGVAGAAGSGGAGGAGGAATTSTAAGAGATAGNSANMSGATNTSNVNAGSSS
ncbi:MAG TPA: hypothetical protein VIV60_14935 [Polyangiaceae bacterium]